MARATSTRTSLIPTILLDGRVVGEEFSNSLLHLRVDLSVHTAGRVTMQFEDPFLSLFDGATFQLGKDLEVKTPNQQGEPTLVFTGKVTGVGVEDEYEPGSVSIPRLVVEAHDGSQALAASTTYEAYNGGAKDVVTKIAQRHGLTPKVVGSPKIEKYVLQAGTDHETLTELARRCGYEWFTDGTTLHFRERPSPSGPTLARSDGTLLRFTAKYSGLTTPSKVQVHGWDGISGTAHTGEASGTTAGTAAELGSDAPFVREQYGKAKTAFGKELTVGDPGSRDAAEAAATATGLARELVGAGLQAEGLARSSPGVVAGGHVTIEDMGSKLSGTYYVTEVTHEFGSDRDLLTTFRSGGHRPEPAPWSPAFGNGPWGTRGPVVAKVSNLNDPEKLGRVKVEFPSLGGTESDWARVVSPGAGKAGGLDFRPEVNDEVLVVFERGDVRFPLVLGGLWNKEKPLHREDLTSGDTVTARAIRFSDDRNKTSHFHELEFTDSAQAGGTLTIRVGNDTRVQLSEDGGVVIHVEKGDLKIANAGGSKIELKENGDLTIDVKGKLDIKAAQALSVEGSQSVEVKSGTSAKVKSGSTLDLEAGATGTLKASGPLTVKGAMVKIN